MKNNLKLGKVEFWHFNKKKMYSKFLNNKLS
jgi:hypothetical protein